MKTQSESLASLLCGATRPLHLCGRFAFHRSFNVESLTSTSIMVMIQNNDDLVLFRLSIVVMAAGAQKSVCRSA
jgi:hypothetical protein